MNSRLRTTLGMIWPVAVAVVAAFLIRTTLMQTYSIPSDSMWPTLQTGDHIVVTPYGQLAGALRPGRGDVVVFRGPAGDPNFYVKRVIALPGEEIRIDGASLFLDGHPLAETYLRRNYDNGFLLPRVLGRGEYFVMGDRRTDSIDSRDWGPLPGDRVVGRVQLIFWSSGDGSTEFRQAIASAGPGRHPAVPRTVRWRRVFSLIR